MEIQDNKFRKPSMKIALIFYIFMMFLGSSLFLFLIAFLYINNNPDIEYTTLINSLSGLVDPMELTDNYKKAYSIVGSLGNMLGYLVMTVVVVYYMRDHLILDASDFKVRFNKLAIYLPISAILFYIITIIVDNFIIGPMVGVSENQDSIVLMISNGGALPMFIAVVICAPLVEELIYRKAIFKLLEKKHIIIPYIVSVLFFVLPHMISTDFSNPGKWFLLSIPYVVSAILLALTYHFSGKNIYSTWFVHLMNNLVAYILIVVTL